MIVAPFLLFVTPFPDSEKHDPVLMSCSVLRRFGEVRKGGEMRKVVMCLIWRRRCAHARLCIRNCVKVDIIELVRLGDFIDLSSSSADTLEASDFTI